MIILPAMYYEEIIDIPALQINQITDFPLDFINAMIVFMRTGEKPEALSVLERKALNDFYNKKTVWLICDQLNMILFAVEVIV